MTYSVRTTIPRRTILYCSFSHPRSANVSCTNSCCAVWFPCSSARCSDLYGKKQRNKIPSDETSNVPLIEKRFPSIFSTFCMSRPFSSVVVGGNRISLWNCIRDRAFNYFINTDSAAIYCQIVCRENGRAFEYLHGDRSGYGRIITCLCYIVSYCCRFRMVSSSVRLFPTYGCNIAVSFLCFATFETFFLVIFVVGSGVWGRLAVVGVRKRGLPDGGE